MKRLIALLLCLIMALFLAACGEVSGQDSDPVRKADEETPAVRTNIADPETESMVAELAGLLNSGDYDAAHGLMGAIWGLQDPAACLQAAQLLGELPCELYDSTQQFELFMLGFFCIQTVLNSDILDEEGKTDFCRPIFAHAQSNGISFYIEEKDNKKRFCIHVTDGDTEQAGSTEIDQALDVDILYAAGFDDPATPVMSKQELAAAQANPASEFEYIVTNKEADEEYHRIDITKYIGNADTVVIPAIIDGYPVDSIGREAFSTENGVALIKQIEIQEGISEIYPEAFYGQSELENIYIPNSTFTIGLYAFAGCSSLTEITLRGENANYLGQYMFKDCEKLERVIIEGDFDAITNEIFTGAPIKQVVIGSTLPYIDAICFIKDSITTIEVSPDNPYLASQDGVLYDKSMTTLCAYPLGKTDTHFIVPDSVQIINDHVFQFSGILEKLTFPEGLTTIGKHVGQCCPALTEVYIPKSVTSIGQASFNQTNNTTAGLTLYVKDGSGGYDYAERMSSQSSFSYKFY